MELNGHVLIAAPREQVWQALNDSAVLRECIPGCEEIVDESPTERRARVMVKMGPVRARFSGRVVLSEVEPPLRCVMGFEGSGGAAGMASGRSQVELHEEAGATRLSYSVKASVAGKLGQIGGRMMDASAKQLADQFFGALQARMAPPAADEADAPEASSTPAPAAAQPLPPPGLPALAGAAMPAQAPDAPRLLWFFMGVAATVIGVVLGALLF